MDILSIKIKQDLLKMSLEYIKHIEYIKDKDIPIDKFIEWIEPIITKYVDKTSFNEIFKDNCKWKSEERCTARLWNNRKEKRCTHRCIEGTYCRKHFRMIQQEGGLRFGDIKEPRPEYDLLKPYREKLEWDDTNILDEIGKILQEYKLQLNQVINKDPCIHE